MQCLSIERSCFALAVCHENNQKFFFRFASRIFHEKHKQARRDCEISLSLFAATNYVYSPCERVQLCCKLDGGKWKLKKITFFLVWAALGCTRRWWQTSSEGKRRNFLHVQGASSSAKMIAWRGNLKKSNFAMKCKRDKFLRVVAWLQFLYFFIESSSSWPRKYSDTKSLSLRCVCVLVHDGSEQLFFCH